MKVIVLLIIGITISSCGIKTKISCNVDDIDNVIEDCKKKPTVGVSTSFQTIGIATANYIPKFL